MASSGKSLGALLCSIFLAPLGIEGFILGSPIKMGSKGPYGKLGRDAFIIGITKIVLFVVFIGLVVAAYIDITQEITCSETRPCTPPQTCQNIQGTGMGVCSGAPGTLLGMPAKWFTAYTITGGILGILSIVSVILCIMSFSKVKH